MHVIAGAYLFDLPSDKVGRKIVPVQLPLGNENKQTGLFDKKGCRVEHGKTGQWKLSVRLFLNGKQKLNLSIDTVHVYLTVLLQKKK